MCRSKMKAMNLFAVFRRKPGASKCGTRKVMLITCNSGLKIVEAKETQSGWIAAFHGNGDDFCLLGANGEILCGPSYVSHWFRHSGWEGGEKMPVKM